MDIEWIKQMSPLERYLYWIRERWNIYLKKTAGKPAPWTDDVILQSYYFTNVYRELDKTTAWFRENIRTPLIGDPAVLMATVIFRWFNKIETGQVLKDHKLFTNWNEAKAVKVLQELNKHQPVFTGAYMIKCGNGPPGCKIPMVCNAISEVWYTRKDLVLEIENSVCCTLEHTHKILCGYKGLGDFMSYEIVCDLRYTYLLENAPDVDTWANPGPGCLRGLLRLEGGVPKTDPKGRTEKLPKIQSPLGKLHNLLKVLRERFPNMPHFELREAEGGCCEFSKYENALWGDGGRMKRRYNGVGSQGEVIL